jgi:hypothetical protein
MREPLAFYCSTGPVLAREEWALVAPLRDELLNPQGDTIWGTSSSIRERACVALRSVKECSSMLASTCIQQRMHTRPS